MNSVSQSRNCLSYWYPKLVESGVRTPKTAIVPFSGTSYHFLEPASTREEEEAKALIAQIQAATAPFALPCFLRTGHIAGKHGYRRTCWLPERDTSTIYTHVNALAEASEMAGIFGVPVDIWAVRELLSPSVFFHAFEGLPIAPEVRFFLSEGEVVSHLPYWPKEAIKSPDNPIWEERLGLIDGRIAQQLFLTEPLAERVARQFQGDGDWSLDLMLCGREWYAIDMAVAQDSWACPPRLLTARERVDTREGAVPAPPDPESFFTDKET